MYTNQVKGGAKKKAVVKDDNLVKFATKLAKNHEIQVIPSPHNATQGNCLFESIIDNINALAKDPTEKLNDGIDSYRELWITELEERYKKTN